MTIALRFAVTLPTLLVAHNVADHVVQTDHQAANKASSWPAMAGHIGGYLATAEAAVQLVGAVTGVRPSWRRRLAGHVLSGATHAFLDRRWPVVRALELTGSAGFARPQMPSVFVDGTVDGATIYSPSGKDPAIGVARTGPLPLHGPYLADQALHHGCLLLAALVMAGGTR